MKRVLVAGIVMIGVAMTAAAYAHHSFAATYDEREIIEIEGELVQFLWRNPHSFVHVVAEDKDGKSQRWAAEWGGGGQLARMGVARDSLSVGDHIVVTGNPSRTPGDYRLRLRTIFRPSDNWRWGGEFD